jgi:acetyl/propionyl-CoA carboxylase alpha subunit
MRLHTQVRINGEDPARDFQPTPGDLGNVEFPQQSQKLGVRVDTWVETGTQVCHGTVCVTVRYVNGE